MSGFFSLMMRLKAKLLLKSLQSTFVNKRNCCSYLFRTPINYIKYPSVEWHRTISKNLSAFAKSGKIYTENELKAEVIESETRDDVGNRGITVSSHQDHTLYQFIQNHKSADKKQWDEIKEEVLKYKIGYIKEKTFSGRVMECCCGEKNLSLGRSYLSYLKTEGLKLNLGIICSYLKLCGKCKSECTTEDFNRIKRFTNDLLKKFPILDIHLRDSLIIAFSITDQWEKSIELFDGRNEADTPKIDVSVVLLNLLLDKNKIDKFWDVINVVVTYGIPIDDVYLNYIDKYKQDDKMLKLLLHFFSGHSIKVNHNVAEKLREVFTGLPGKEKCEGAFTHIQHGLCKVCNQHLNLINISDEEFDRLRTQFLEKVVIGENIFTKSTPAEVAGFINYVRNTSPYDIVIDGLNVAYMKNIRHPTMNNLRLMDFSLLETLLEYFIERNKKVLVIGRKHMKRLAKWHSQNISKNVLVYLTDDSSSDDQFMLYATMYSGINTYFISRDLMRKQKFKLSDPTSGSIFKRWQLCRQYKIKYIDVGRNVYFQDPLIYDMSAQMTKKHGWHIPYLCEGTTDVDSYEIHQHWLCLHPRL